MGKFFEDLFSGFSQGAAQGFTDEVEYKLATDRRQRASEKLMNRKRQWIDDLNEKAGYEKYTFDTENSKIGNYGEVDVPIATIESIEQRRIDEQLDTLYKVERINRLKRQSDVNKSLEKQQSILNEKTSKRYDKYLNIAKKELDRRVDNFDIESYTENDLYTAADQLALRHLEQKDSRGLIDDIDRNVASSIFSRSNAQPLEDGSESNLLGLSRVPGLEEQRGGGIFDRLGTPFVYPDSQNIPIDPRTGAPVELLKKKDLISSAHDSYIRQAEIFSETGEIEPKGTSDFLLESLWDQTKRAGRAFGQGAAGMVKGGGGFLKWMGQKLGSENIEYLGEGYVEYAKLMDEEYHIEDPTFFDKYVSGLASASSFIIPGVAVGKLTNLAKYGPKVKALAEALGVTVASVLEAGIESGSKYEEMVDLKGKEEADKIAGKNFTANLITLMGTNWLGGIFNQGSKGLTSFLKGAAGEGVQEAIQEYISVVSEGDVDPFTKETAQRAAESGAIGALVGGSVAGVQTISDKIETKKYNQDLTEKDIDRMAREEKERVEASKKQRDELLKKRRERREEVKSLPPHEVTLEEYLGKLNKDGQFTERLTEEHAAYVEKALQDGKMISKEVMESHPELIEKYGIDPNLNKGIQLKEVKPETILEVSEIPSQEVLSEPVQRGLSPIEGIGKIKERGLPKNIELKSIENQLTEGFGDLPEYATANMKEHAEKASEILKTDSEKAKKIAMGEEQAPEGMIPEAFLVAVENEAIKNGDVETIRDLALNSKLNIEATTMGQRIRTLAERNPESISGAIKAISEARKSKSEKLQTSQENENTINELKTRLDELETRLSEITTPKIQRRAFGSKNKVFTRERLERARKSLNMKASRLHSGIDPTALVDLVEIGGYYFEGGIRNFAEWSSTIVKEFGEATKPYLNKAWATIKDEVKKNESKTDYEIINKKFEETKSFDSSRPQITKIAEGFVKQGINDPIELANKVKDVLSKFDPEITTREVMDLISGYGEFKELSKDQIKVKLRDLKGQLQQIAKLEDLQQGVPPLKTGIERRTPSDAERHLIKQVEEAKKKFGIKTDNKTQLKSALDSLKTRLKNQIKDLEIQITTRKKIVKTKSDIKLDNEAKNLMRRRDELKSLFNQIFEKPEVSLEKRIELAERMLVKSIDIYEHRIAKGDIGPLNKKAEPVFSEKLSELRKKRDSLKNKLKQMRELRNPKKTKDEIALQSLKTRLKNQIEKLEMRLEVQDFNETPKTKIELDREAKKLKEERDRVKRAYDTAIENKELITKDEIKKLLEMSKEVMDAKVNIDHDSKDGSESRLKYGAAHVAFTEYVNDLKTKRNRYDFLKNPYKLIREILASSKSFIASIDNSVIGRQGIKIAATHPKIWAKNSAQTFKSFYRTLTGKNALAAIKADIASRKNALNGLYKKHKLAVGVTEETYPSNLPEMIPLIGKFFKASEHAFVGFSYKTRADLFDRYVEMVGENQGNLEGFGILANSLTGRGNLGRAEPAADTINLLLFSPRFLKSNIDALTAHALDKNLSSAARKEAAKNTIKIITSLAGLLGFASILGDDEDWVEWDPKSSDFGKIRIGDTRFDVTGGMGSLVVLASRLIKKQVKSSVTGITTDLNTDEYNSRTKQDVVFNFFENKLSPLASVINQLYLKEETFKGEKPSIATVAESLLVPITIQTAIEMYQNPNSANFVLGTLADALGIGANTYSLKEVWSPEQSETMEKLYNKIGKEEFEKRNKAYNKQLDTMFKNIEKSEKWMKMDNDQKRDYLSKRKKYLKKEMMRRKSNQE